MRRGLTGGTQRGRKTVCVCATHYTQGRIICQLCHIVTEILSASVPRHHAKANNKGYGKEL